MTEIKMAGIKLTTAFVLCSGLVLTARQDTPTLAHAVGYYDTRINRVVIVGESSDPVEGTSDRAWSWNGSRWEPIAGTGPASRTNAGAAYEQSRRRAVVAGGSRKTGERWSVVGDSWIESNGRWQAIAGIPARDHNTLVDAHDGSVLMFGGIPADRSAVWPTDTFVLRDQAWVQVATDGPAGRGRTAMAFDRVRNQVVLFGGVSGDRDQVFFNDTWIWNGTRWRKAADGGPRGRYAHGMAFDAKRGVVLLYSGAAAHKGAPLADMWQWDGLRWTEIPLTGPTPGYRYQSVMAYDVARDRTVLYGGITGARDTWEWDGSRWSQVDNRN